MKDFLALIQRNWKTALAGSVGFLANVPVLISAITDWGEGKPFAWRPVMSGIALAAIATGVFRAKDDNNHSTNSEVAGATKATPPSLVSPVPPQSGTGKE